MHIQAIGQYWSAGWIAVVWIHLQRHIDNIFVLLSNKSISLRSMLWHWFLFQEGGWRLEGLAFPTIQELIINQHKSNTAVTNKSQAILRTPIMRETWQIKNDDIKLEDKIGNVSCNLLIATYPSAPIFSRWTYEHMIEDTVHTSGQQYWRFSFPELREAIA